MQDQENQSPKTNSPGTGSVFRDKLQSANAAALPERLAKAYGADTSSNAAKSVESTEASSTAPAVPVTSETSTASQAYSPDTGSVFRDKLQGANAAPMVTLPSFLSDRALSGAGVDSPDITAHRGPAEVQPQQPTAGQAH